MTVCPIALAIGCKKCPVFAVCPLKSVIGDYKEEAPPPKRAASGKTRSSAKARK